jgi:hypothetical protein
MKYNNLYVFGDSFSTPHSCVEPRDSYWGLVAQYAHIDEVINYSSSGQAWEGVLHLITSLYNEINFRDSLLIISIPPLERRLRFDDYKNTEYVYYTYNSKWDEFKSINNNLTGLEVLRGFDENGIVRDEISLFSDRSWLETILLRELFLLTKWLDSENASYVITTMAKDIDQTNLWGPSEKLLPYILNHPRILNKDTYHYLNMDDGIKPADYDQYGWAGHHGIAGNKNFFEKSLLPKLKELNLV